MTDYERKLNEVKNNTTIEDFESYESTDDEQVIIVYYSDLDFTEYVYTKEGKYTQTICHEWHLNKDGQLTETIIERAEQAFSFLPDHIVTVLEAMNKL